MELPNQNHPLLFDQMLQMFPNIPHNIILLYTLQYSNDVEKCIEMLKMQNLKYTTETGRTDLILNISADHQLNIVNIKPNQLIDSYDEENFNKPFQSSNSSQLNVFNNNSEIEYVIQNEMNDEFPNFEQNLQCSKENLGEEFFQNKELISSAESSNIHPQYSLPMPDNKNSVENQPEIFANSVLNISPLHLEASPALHVNVVDNEEGNHSWRPNTTFDGLYADFFLSSPFFDNNTKTTDALKYPLSQSNACSELDQISLSAFPVKNLSNPFVSSTNFQFEDRSTLSNDVLNILNFQRIQLNVMKYEVMKSKTELDNLKEEVGKLSSELKEKKHSREALNIKELGKQNSELRMECQCLCMEVDYYLKGKALLGETDESTYRNKQPPTEQAACHHHNTSNEDDSFDPADELDELNKWDCSKCTFANHPAINACEMCQMPRLKTRHTVFSASVPETCYCHSSTESHQLSS